MRLAGCLLGDLDRALREQTGQFHSEESLNWCGDGDWASFGSKKCAMRLTTTAKLHQHSAPLTERYLAQNTTRYEDCYSDPTAVGLACFLFLIAIFIVWRMTIQGLKGSV